MKVLTIGTFDRYHAGHVNLFAACHRLAGPTGEVIVGVNSDRFVAQYKGVKVQPFDERLARVEMSGYVSRAVENDGPGRELIEIFMPDLLVIGTDWAVRDYYAQIGMTRRELEHLGVLLVYVAYTEGISSTYLRAHDEQR